MASYYHACRMRTLDKIAADGCVRRSLDGCVYLCTSPEEAARFVALRLLGTDETEIPVLRFDHLDESLIEETFDHSEAFWGCRCWGYFEDIPAEAIDGIERVTFVLMDRGDG